MGEKLQQLHCGLLQEGSRGVIINLEDFFGPYTGCREIGYITVMNSTWTGDI